MPDATLPVTAITSLICSILGYLSYQGVLKSSLNRNKLTINEAGIVQAIIENDLPQIIEEITQESEEDYE